MSPQSGTTVALCALLFAAAAATAAPDYQCVRTCKFAFCGYARGQRRDRFAVGGAADTPFTPAICDKRGGFVVGSVDSTGEAFVETDAGRVPISQWSPDGLLQPFTPHFFKAFFFGHEARSGVGHETFQTNQLDFMDGRCIVLPLTAYQVLDGDTGNVVNEVHPSGAPFYDCVSFTTYTH